MKATTRAALALALLGEISALCFVNETVTVKKTLLSQPSVVDEYHCKILCAEMTTCLSYIHKFDHCALLGGKKESSLSCTLPNAEMVKKTKVDDCKVPFSPKPIAAEYIRNPATTTGEVVPMNTSSGQPCGTEAVIIDATLPDNTHMVLGNTQNTKLTWDDKLGSWVLTDEKKSLYLRAAQCIKPLDKEFDSTSSCPGGVITRCGIATSGYSTPSAIKFYGVAGACSKQKDQNFTLWNRWSDEGAVQRFGQTINTRLLCIYGAWFTHYSLTKDTALITCASCAVKTGSG